MTDLDSGAIIVPAVFAEKLPMFLLSQTKLYASPPFIHTGFNELLV
jgi:hypothetical protein